VPKGTRADEFESAVRTVCEPIFNKPLKEISFAQVLLRLFETARRFDMPSAAAADSAAKDAFQYRRLGSRASIRNLTYEKTAQPVLRAWMRERIDGPARAIGGARARRTTGPTHIGCPAAGTRQRILQSALRDAAEGRFRLPVENTQMEELRNEMRPGQRSTGHRDRPPACCGFPDLFGWGCSRQYRWLGWVQN